MRGDFLMVERNLKHTDNSFRVESRVQDGSRVMLLSKAGLLDWTTDRCVRRCFPMSKLAVRSTKVRRRPTQ